MKQQYLQYEEKFKDKYEGSSVEISEVDDNLIEWHVVPKPIDWIVLLDHEGNIVFMAMMNLSQRPRIFSLNFRILIYNCVVPKTQRKIAVVPGRCPGFFDKIDEIEGKVGF